MPIQYTLEERKEKRIEDYLTFLHTLNKTSETYLYLMDLQSGRGWLFGSAEEDFNLGEKQEDGSYRTEQWVNGLHPKDQPAFIKDLTKIVAGEKDRHNLDYRVLGRDGRYTWVNCQGTVEHDDEGRPFFMVGRISATYLRYKLDGLTGLFNQNQLREDLKEVLSEKKKGVFMEIGVDNMKNINTIRGRIAGDGLLQFLASALEEEVSVKAYRVGGDVFAVFSQDADVEEARSLFNRLQGRVNGKFTISGGAVLMDSSVRDVSWLEQYSDFAMRKAKESGKNTLEIFTMEDYHEAEDSAALLDELMRSVENGCEGFSLVYQPQMRTGTYSLFGAEALLRYESPVRGRGFPDEFISLLERFDLMYPVGAWVMREALKQCREWRKYCPDFHVSVNMSFSQLLRPEIREEVPRILEQSGLPGDALTIEVTESMQLQDYQYYNEIFEGWKKLGVDISVDDFGTGYSSLGYLKNLSINEIKIDRCFVSGIQTSSYNYLLLKNIVELADESQIRVCCEGVEETAELQVLEELHSNLLQGYLFSKPCDAGEFEKRFLDKNSEEYAQYLQKVSDMEEVRLVGYLNMQHTDILRSVEMGLWMLRVTDERQTMEMYIDETMRHVMGLEEKLSPTENYHYMLNRVRPEQQPYVLKSLRHIMDTGHVTRMHFFWNHPEKGEVEVAETGVRVDTIPGEVCIQGYHRIISDIDDLSCESGDDA